MGPDHTAIRSTKPVISVCAVRTGAGKSQTTRAVANILRDAGQEGGRGPAPHALRRPGQAGRAALRHDARTWTATSARSRSARSTSPTSSAGNIVYAGVDYEAILRQAEKEADVILWDGGNNDFSFYKPDLEIVVADPHRPGHETALLPGRGQPAHGRRDRDEQGGHRHPRGRRHGAWRVSRSVNPEAIVIDGRLAPHGGRSRGHPRARRCWWWRTAPRSRTAR